MSIRNKIIQIGRNRKAKKILGLYLQCSPLIPKFKKGDGVIIRAGAGFPKIEEDTRDVIAAIDGGFLTASGKLLSCRESVFIRPTGEHFNNFPLSPLAKRIKEEGVESVYPEYFEQNEET